MPPRGAQELRTPPVIWLRPASPARCTGLATFDARRNAVVCRSVIVQGVQSMGQQHEKSWPVLASLASWRAADLPGDLIAGLTLAAIAVPEQMATARLGGFEPQIGFFAFIAGSVGFALLGGNRFLSCGADSTITPIFAGGLLLMAASGSPNYVALAMALALLVGVILVASSLFRLGWIAN